MLNFISLSVAGITRVLVPLLLLVTVSLQAAQTSDRLNRPVTDLKGKQISYYDADRDIVGAATDIHQLSSLIVPTPDIAEHVQWVWATLGTGIGLGLLDSADLDGDGDIEVITTGGGVSFGGTSTIFVLENDLTKVACMLDQVSQPLDYHIQQLDGDKALEVLLVTPTEVLMMDGASCVIEARTPFPSTVDGGGVGDVNNDGVPDVAYAVGSDLFIAPWNDFSNPLKRLGFGGARIIIEDLGRAGGDDIGVAANVLFILRGDTLETITEIHDPVSSMIDFGDIDGDGDGDVIIGTAWTHGISVIDVASGELVLEVPFGDLAIFKAQDIDQDGDMEIVYGDGQWGSVGVLDGDGTVLYSIANPSHGVTNVLITDLQGDGALELLWGAGHTDTGSDHLYSGDLSTELITFTSIDIDGPFQLSDPGPFSPTGGPRVAASFAKSNSGYDVGGVATLDMANGNLLDQFPAVDTNGWGTVTSVAAANNDGDQAWEVCFSGDDTYDEFISCRDTVSGETEWFRQISNGYIYQLKLEDIDGDGQKELLTINSFGVVSSYNASNGFLEWVSEDLSTDFITWGFDGLAMVNGDLWVVFPSGNIRKLNPVTGELVDSDDSTLVTQIATRGATVYANRSGEGVGVLNPVTLELDTVLYPTTDNLGLLSLSGDGSILLAASGTRPDFMPVLISVNSTFAPVQLGQMTFWDEHITDRLQLLLATPHGVTSIELGWQDVIFSSGFE